MKIRHDKTTKQKRALRVRSKLFGTAKRPRISVHRTNKHLYVQAIDDKKQVTLVAANDKQLEKKSSLTKTEKARLVGQLLAKRMKAKKITAGIFDRGSFRYQGRVKAVAEALRAEGIKL